MQVLGCFGSIWRQQKLIENDAFKAEKLTQFTLDQTISAFFTLLIWTFVPEIIAAFFYDYFTIKIVNVSTLWLIFSSSQCLIRL